MQQFKAFTVEYSGRASSLQTQCGVCPGVAIEALAAGEKHPEVKAYVVDDFGFTMSNYFMREHSKGRRGNEVYTMYNEIGDSVYRMIEAVKALPDDIIVYIIMHEDIADDGSFKLRTVGKLCDEKINLEGRLTICIRCVNDAGDHKFITNDDAGIGKSPEEMLPQEMPNDLKAVDTAIREFYGMN